MGLAADGLLERFVAGIPDHAVYLLDAAGAVASWNAGAERIYGYPPREILGRAFVELFTAEDCAAGLPTTMLAEARESGQARREGWRVRKDGSRFWAVASLAALRDEAGELIAYGETLRDVTQERLTQAELTENHRRFRFLMDGVADYAIYLMDPHGAIIDWNRGAERLTGYDADDVVGRHFGVLFDEKDRRAGLPAAVLASALAEGRYEGEGWRVRKDGSRFWALAAVGAIRDDTDGQVGFAVITRDVTREKLERDRLTESERRFRLLVEGVTDYAIFMVDKNGLINNWNRGAERIKGYRAEEAIGRHFGVFYIPEERAAGAPARALAAALENGRHESEGWRLRKDGSRIWASAVIEPICDDDGRHMGFAMVTRDISERRAAANALAQSEREFRLLVSQLSDYALFMLDPNGIVTTWNVGAQRIKGYASDEIVGRHFSTFYTEADRAAGLPSRVLEIARTEGRYEAEGWRVRKGGQLFWASVVVDAIHDEQGVIIGFAKVTRDMTERREAELQLQRTNERLAQVQKMDALGQLTGGVAHDFNNLLTVVAGRTQMLKRKLAERPDLVDHLDAIDVAASRGAALTRHLLTFARRQRVQPTRLVLAERAKPLAELLSASLPPTVKLAFALPKSLWDIEADAAELELALLNLVVNARDAMPSGGQVSLSAANVRCPPPESLRGQFVALKVVDSGVGIPPDVLPKIFEPFFTTKEVGKGTGLGLSQVFGFAEQSGGRLTVESALGKGSTFTLYLPRAGAEAGALQEAAPLASAPPGARILVVEDNPEVAAVAAGLLAQLGHRPHLVQNAVEALAAAAADDSYDLVFSDVVMAGEMDGVALARRLRELRPDLPILLATGYSDAAGKAASEFRILRKPYRLEDLNAEIDRILAEQLAVREGRLVPLRRARGA